MKLIMFLLLLSAYLVSCSTADKDSDWDSGASKVQADRTEDESELQNNVRNQAPPLTSP